MNTHPVRDQGATSIHDETLTRTTNVESLFAQRNGGYAVSDFTLAEIRTLTVDIVPVSSAPGYVSSYGSGHKVPTFAEVLDFANQWRADTGVDLGVYPEAKAADAALNLKLVQTLAAKGFQTTADGAYIQSFSVAALDEIESFQLAEGTDIDLVSLGYWVGGPLTGGAWTGTDGSTTLADVAGKVDGLGIYIGFGLSTDQDWLDFIDYAHSLDLSVVGWTFGEGDEQAALAQFDRFIGFGMDGFFANYPDYAVSAVSAASPVPGPAALLLLPLGMAALAGLRLRLRRA